MRFARGVSRRVAWVAEGAAKKGERVSSICVGCVVYVACTSSALAERARESVGGGEEDNIGSRRYIMC